MSQKGQILSFQRSVAGAEGVEQFGRKLAEAQALRTCRWGRRELQMVMARIGIALVPELATLAPFGAEQLAVYRRFQPAMRLPVATISCCCI